MSIKYHPDKNPVSRFSVWTLDVLLTAGGSPQNHEATHRMMRCCDWMGLGSAVFF